MPSSAFICASAIPYEMCLRIGVVATVYWMIGFSPEAADFFQFMAVAVSGDWAMTSVFNLIVYISPNPLLADVGFLGSFSSHRLSWALVSSEFRWFDVTLTLCADCSTWSRDVVLPVRRLPDHAEDDIVVVYLVVLLVTFLLDNSR